MNDLREPDPNRGDWSIVWIILLGLLALALLGRLM